MSGQTKLTPDTLAELNHLPSSEVARRLGYHERTIQRWRVRFGLAEPGPDHRWSAETVARVEALLDEGWSYKDVARTLGHSESTVANHFPGRAWTPQQCGRHGREVRTLNELRAA